jgi:hypothetical protein
MRPTLPPPRFLPVPALDRIGRLVFSGRAVHARQGGGVSGDGLWREADRADGGTLFLLVDVEGKGPVAAALLDVLEMALGDSATWDRTPGDLLVELHSQAGQAWAQTQRSFVAQALLVQGDHLLLASAGMPLPCRAAVGGAWETVDAPSQSIALLGRPDLHEEGEPLFPDRRVDLTEGDRYLAVSDGITEAGRPRVLGQAGLLRLLDALPPRLGPDAILRLVFALAAECDGTAWAGDDSTGLCWRLDRPRS